MCALSVELAQVELNDDDYLLLSVKVNGESARITIDSYDRNGQLFVAIEPLFNGLKLRYQLREDQLRVWKGEQDYIFSFSSTKGMVGSSTDSWATDGYYQYISQDVLEIFFDIGFEIDKPRLALNLITLSYSFPITLLAEQALSRSVNKIYSYGFQQRGYNSAAITIPDQYNLFTLPHGDIRTSMDFSDDKEKIKTNIQLVSDLFYHSARLSLNKVSGGDLSGGLSFSRFKTSPNDRIFDAFDRYRFGDISSSLGAGIISGSSGVGVVFEREPEGYRRSNSKIDIEQDARPGWDAELFLNGRFVAAATVPDTGLLIFENIDIYYGPNEFQIKVYGPFAEVDSYHKSYPLIANPLANGELAYNIHALDNTRSLFNNTNEASGLSIKSLGGSFDYGVNDIWQLGLTFQERKDFDDNQQFFSIHNYVNLPGFLLESEFAFNGDADFSQQTSLSGNIFGGAAFQLRYESNHGLSIANSSSLVSDDFKRLTASYSSSLGNVPIIFRAGYGDVKGNRTYTLTNNVYFTYKRLRFSHDLYLSRLENDTDDEVFSRNNVSGNLGVSGRLFKNLRLSANLNYDPEATDIVSDSSFFTAQYTWDDPFAYRHYFNFRYRPLTEENNEWQLSHSLAYETPDYRLSLNSSFDAQHKWNIGLNVNFFLGYDYHNNRALPSSSISSESAMLNIHSYLDRQLNGVPDVLDYDLEGVEFQGSKEWEGLKSGEKGRVILPGVATNTPFSFGATWKHGTKTINNDYVIYTHPGARIDVNMPFYLNTELAGFVYRSAENGEIPVSELLIELIDKDNKVLHQLQTDSDGYFEFNNMQPSSYKIVMNVQSLRNKGLTTETLGYSLSTPSVGGFTELPVLLVRQLRNDDDRGKEEIIDFILTEDSVELLVWDEDEEKRQNYFTLPTKQKVRASHSQIDSLKTVDSIIALLKPVAKVSTTSRPLLNINNVLIDDRKVNSEQFSGEYSIQFGAFVSLDKAQAITDKFTNRTPIKARIVKIKNEKWQTIYKVYLGSFAQRAAANSYAKRYQLSESEYIISRVLRGEEITGLKVDKKTVEIAALPLPKPALIGNTQIDVPALLEDDYRAKNWVIQFYASQSIIDAKEALPFSAMGNVFMAQKAAAQTDQTWYCLISNGFDTKALAQQALADAKVQGWVNRSQLYSGATKI